MKGLKNIKGNFFTITDEEGLLGIVQSGALEIHTWGCHSPAMMKADQVVFDLDPDDKLPWKKVIAACLDIKKRLDEIGLESFIKTSGGKGFHICIPITPDYDWNQVKLFCKSFVETLERISPGLYVSKMTKSLRQGKIFLDYLRNQEGATSVSAYSTRMRDSAPVSMPVGWDELPKIKSASQFDISNVIKILQKRDDPWKNYFKVKQSLPIKRLLKAIF